MLRSRRANDPTRDRVRTPAARTSPGSATGSCAETARTGRRGSGRCAGEFGTAWLVLQPAEGGVGRLPSAGGGEEPGLPATERALVPDQEPDEHPDPPVFTRDRVRLREVLRLRLPGDAEELVGRTRLVAVFGDPDRLATVEPRDLLGQVADVAEDHRRPLQLLRLRRRALARHRRVRMMGPGVEAPQAVALREPEKGERRDRRAAALRLVVAERVGRAAGDALGADAGAVDAGIDRVADACVLVRAEREPATVNLLVLRRQEVRVVRLVPCQPEPDGRQQRLLGVAVLALEGARVALCGSRREVLEVAVVRGGDPRRTAAVRPCRRPLDAEEHLDLVLLGEQ